MREPGGWGRSKWVLAMMWDEEIESVEMEMEMEIMDI